MSTGEQMQRVVSAELGEMLDVSRTVSETYSDISERVRTMSDDELMETIVYVSRVENNAGWLRGLCVLEVRRRVGERAEAARLSGTNINVQVERGKATRLIASQTGVAERTLRNDAAVVEVLAPIVAERMTAAEPGSAAVMPPEGVDWSVLEVIAKEKDPDRAYDVMLDIRHDHATVHLQTFCQSLADRKKEEGADDEPPPVVAPALPVAARRVVIRTENVSGTISYDAKAKLLKLQEKENLPTLALALERAIEIAWDVVSKRRSDARNAVK